MITEPTQVYKNNPSFLTYKGCEIAIISQNGNPVYDVSVKLPTHSHSLGCRKDYNVGLKLAADYINKALAQ